MRVAKWGNNLAVRLPAAVVEALDPKEGDDIEIDVVGRRAARAEALFASGYITGVRALNASTDVARRELGPNRDEIDGALRPIRTLCRTIVPLDLGVHADGLRLARDHRLALFDAMLVAAALRSGCGTFWSEEVHHGLIVDGTSRVLNPFAAP